MALITVTTDIFTGHAGFKSWLNHTVAFAKLLTPECLCHQAVYFVAVVLFSWEGNLPWQKVMAAYCQVHD